MMFHHLLNAANLSHSEIVCEYMMEELLELFCRESYPKSFFMKYDGLPEYYCTHNKGFLFYETILIQYEF